MRDALRLAPVFFLAAACGTSSTGNPDGGAADLALALPPWLSDARILVSGQANDKEMDCRTRICRHNENTDLVNYKGAIYFVHRTARSQVLGPNCALHVYRYIDGGDGGKSFQETARIEAPMDRDLRDPHFYQVGGELYIKALTRLPVTSQRDSDVDTVAVATHSPDGQAFTALQPIGPKGWSFWRIRERAGVLYTAAYQDGDLAVALFSSTDGLAWTRGADIYTVSADTPLETELTFMPSGRMLALVRMDGTDQELLGDRGRLRTKVCWAEAPYAAFACPQELMGQRLDGPLTFFHGPRLFVLARKHLATGGRKRTALFELGGMLDGGPLTDIDIRELGEVPSAGDTSYAGIATVDGDRSVATWYSSPLDDDPTWIFGIVGITDIWRATLDFTRLPPP